MIPTSIQNLFKFIDFLHSNIDNFKSYDTKIDEYYLLCNQKRKYYNKGFFEKIEYDKLQIEVDNLWGEIKKETILKIINKANELGIRFDGENFLIDFEATKRLHDNAELEDLKTIDLHKNKYLEFRKKSSKVVDLFSGWTFKELDKYLISLFEYFDKDKKTFDFLKPKPPRKTEYFFILPDNFYNKKYLPTINALTSTLENGEVIEAKVHHTYISYLLGYLNDIDTALNEVEVISSYPKTELEGAEKKEALLSIQKIFIKGYKKGLDFFKTELKTNLETLYFKDAERFKNEFEFYLNKRNFATDLNENDIHEYSLPAFLKTTRPRSFKKKNISNWGFLNALYNELINYSKTKPSFQKLVNDTNNIQKPKNMEDFFVGITTKQAERLKELISPLKGKDLAMFISLAYNDFKILNLKPNSKDGFNQKTFIEMQGKTNQSVNKFLDRYFFFTGDKKDLETLEKQLNTILKDS